MSVIIDTPQELTPEWFTGALREAGTLGDHAEVKTATNRVIGNGQVGAIVQSELEYSSSTSGSPDSAIVKLPSTDAASRALGKAVGIYESEVRFYDELASQVSMTVPKRYWGAVEPASGRFTLVLEDVSGRAHVGDMVAGSTLEQAELAMSELPRLQAALWDSPALRTDPWWGDLSRVAMLFAAAEPSLPVFEERFAARIEPELLELARKLAVKGTSVVPKLWTGPLVLGHGDYRLDNMMFATDPGAPPLTVVDWQTTRLAPPLFDAALFIGSGLDTDLRRAHERDLIGLYHDGLDAAGVSGFSLEDCWESYRAGSLFPFVMVIAASVAVQQTERGDNMWSRLISGCGQLVLDTNADELLD
jgi:Phosphotransferase enzyme family